MATESPKITLLLYVCNHLPSSLIYMVTTCLEKLEMSGNLTAVGWFYWKLGNCQGKVA